MARRGSVFLRIAALCQLVSAAATPLAAGFLKPGPDVFTVRSLAAWEGRRVSAVEIQGNRTTHEGVIRREIRTRVGAPLSLTRLDHDVVRLVNLAIFSDVRVEASEAGGGGVRVRFVLKESPSWLPLAAVNYTEVNGLSVGPAVSALNLFGQGIKLDGRAYFGGTTQYRAAFSWPWIWGSNHNSVTLLAARRDRADELRGFHETSQELTPRLGRFLGDHGRVALGFSYFRMHSDVAGITLSPTNDDTLLRLAASLGWDTRDSWRVPRVGWQNELELWKTGGFLGGDGDSWSMNLDLRRWIPTTSRQKLLLSGLVSLQSGRYGRDVPVYLDYRLGGANSVRGYPVETGKELFGKNQILGTAEYSFTLTPLRRWDLAFLSFSVGTELTLFADAGVVWNAPEELGWRRTRGGLGVGLRLLIPSNEMARIDLGWSPEGGLQLHLGGGSKPTAQRGRLR